ncbi:MAG: two-partner secretion domain-containing protein, partial [Burkholderiaceae bacterium]
MNHSYRLIFSSTTSSLIPVAENTRGQGKANRRNSASQFKSNQTGFTLRYLCAALAIVWGGNVHALPQGGQVSSGSGSISQSSNNMTVQQNSQNLSINWQSFGIGAGQSVQFKQPSASSIALNRVLGQDPSQILGNLSANGQVFITNPNGVLFGHGAQVNVGGLVASTGNLTDADLQAKHYRFSNSGTGGTVSNDGTLHAADGGYIALLAPEVRNKGVISARLGTVLLGAGNQTTLQLDNGSLVGYNIDKGAINALADNKQLIQADGGRVIMSAKAANQLARAVVNNSGVIEARTLQNKEGVIRLLGDTKVGEVNLKGTLDASAANGGNGGSIETSAENVKVAKSAVITTAAPTGKTGNWLIKQSNNFIVDNGGNISGDTLGKSLNQTNVTVRTLSLPTQAGDIAVNDFVEWLSSNNLALSSHRDINVNATIANRSGGNLLLRADATGNGTGTVNFGTAGKINQTGGRTDLYYNPVSYTTPTDFTPDIIGSFTGWMLVNDVNHLQAINTNLSGNYALGRNIDASATASWNGGAGFVPIGQNTNFNGQFDGLNHTISDLHINRPTESNVGLFGTAFGPISNVGLVRG